MVELEKSSFGPHYRPFDDTILGWAASENKTNPTNARICPTNVATAYANGLEPLAAEACADGFTVPPRPTAGAASLAAGQ